ncbi:aldehyde dehydrogenase family protein [Novosphingobium bradum]|uniref:Aldehyde dehydrogenase family protein n=1 Tax=Novosphingobium bradum TaxID=1737444 RepID=A0ABV7IR30_9SPHN
MTRFALETRMYIDGAYVGGEGTALPVEHPGNGETFVEFPGASAGQVEQAIAAARRAFDSGCWSGLPDAERVAAVRKLMDFFAANRDRLKELALLEAGAPVSTVVPAQVDMSIQHGYQVIGIFQSLPAFEDNPLPIAERFNAQGKVGQSLRSYVPVGVVGAISAYNFPFYTNLWKVVPALLAGNTVVLRPSPLTPLSALIFGEAAAAAGLPRGVLNVIADKGAEGGVILSEHKDVDMIAFTGSSLVGRAVMAQAAPTMKKLQLELGGKSAQIFLPDALAQAAGAAAMVCMAHAGQGCVLGTRIFVPQEHKEAALQAMAGALNHAAKIGDPANPTTTFGPVISAAQRDRCEHFVKAAVEAGGKVVTGGKRPEGMGNGFFFEPTILDVPDNKNPAAQEEIFGPVVCVIGYRDLDHAVEMANDTIYGLSGHVYGNAREATAVARRLRTGTVNVNGGLTSAYASSGGWGVSGVNRERGPEGVRVYQQVQVLSIVSA